MWGFNVAVTFDRGRHGRNQSHQVMQFRSYTLDVQGFKIRRDIMKFLDRRTICCARVL